MLKVFIALLVAAGGVSVVGMGSDAKPKTKVSQPQVEQTSQNSGAGSQPASTSPGGGSQGGGATG